MLSEYNELFYNIFITMVFAILFLVLLYYFTPISSYRLYLLKVPIIEENK